MSKKNSGITPVTMDKFLKTSQKKSNMDDASPKTSTPAFKRNLSTSSNESMDLKRPRQKSPQMVEITEDQTDDESDADSYTEATEEETTSDVNPPVHPSFAQVPEHASLLQAMSIALLDDTSPLTQAFGGVVKKYINDDLVQINTNYKSLSDRVDKLDAKISKLENKLSQQEELLRAHEATIQSQTAIINQLGQSNVKLTELCNNQQIHNDKMDLLVHNNFGRIDELNQYGRRNLLRISGIPESNKNTDELVIELAKERLNVTISPDDLDRTHRLGDLDAKNTNPRAIVAKFVSYAKRREMFQRRSKLKGSGIYLNDHLTPHRAKLLSLSRCYRRAGLVNSSWSVEGRLLVKENGDPGKDNGRIFELNSVHDLQRFGKLPDQYNPFLKKPPTS